MLVEDSVVRARKPQRLPGGRLVGPAERDRWVRRVRRGGVTAAYACSALGIREGTLRCWMRDLEEIEASPDRQKT